AAHISASSTCALHAGVCVCVGQKCFICDSRLPYDRYSNTNSHRISNIITTFDPDRKMKWWQSENGVHQVSIRLDLETVFQFSHLVLTFKSFRPAAMLVERSKDFGQTWKVFRYFAEDCSLNFPSVSNETADSADDIICDSRYSGSEPSTGGEVVLKALDPVYEIENPYAPNIQDLITLTNIRVNFTRLFTLGDTLLSRRRRNPQDKYYYALYNMVVQGSCFCNGHANRCTPVDGGRGDVHGHCVCQHNTAGENCERCQDFHHDTPWRPGGGDAADFCRRCNCHGHSDMCYFDATRYEATGGVSGGVCDNCRHDRTGPQCERCRPFLYQDPQRTADDPHACIPCDCDPAGSLGDGLCDALSGQCICKQNVEGRRCSRCKPGFFNLRQDDAAGCGREALACDLSYNEPFSAYVSINVNWLNVNLRPLCLCFVQEGFWGLGNSEFRCSPCNCDIGGAHSTMCSPEDGQCHCLPNMIGRRCSEPAAGYFLPPLDYILYEAELAIPLNVGRSPSPTNTPSSSSSLPVTWTGLGLVRVWEGVGLRFSVDNITSSNNYQLIIHYETCCLSLSVYFLSSACSCNVVGSLGPSCSKLGGLCECKPNVIGRCCDNCAPLTFGFGPDGCKSCDCDPRGSVSEVCDQVRGQCACRSKVTGRRCDQCQAGFWGFPFCRPCECNRLSEECDGETGECVDCKEHTTGPHCDRCVAGYYGNPVSRQPCEPCLCPDLQESGRFFATSCQGDPQSFGLMCRCMEGHTGPRCDRCKPGFYGDLTRPGTSCVACPCNDNIDPDDRNACDSLTGECLRCLHHTIGPHCQKCKPGFYGNALDQDCKECSCDRQGTEVTQCPLGSPCFCDPTTGQCPCRRGVEGVLCDKCKDGYWNLDGPFGCQPCSCDPANTLSNICNKVTGQCLCRPEFGGRQCDECGENHFGDPDVQCICEEQKHPSCDPKTGECICRSGVTGIFCDECATGYNLAFPACEECHPCQALWARNVTDVKRATQKMRTFVPHHNDDLRPADGHYTQQIQEMISNLNSLTNLKGLSTPKVEEMEKLWVKTKKLKDTVDPNMTLIDPSPLLNTEINNIQLEFKKLLNSLRDNLRDPDDEDHENLEGTEYIPTPSTGMT
uniref:Laminin subunit beta-1 n=1 Tax=Echeneis naucrates TaxID=173247 RepID=A0A665UDI7_ECHNA